jgi:hypothetical protein
MAMAMARATALAMGIATATAMAKVMAMVTMMAMAMATSTSTSTARVMAMATAIAMVTAMAMAKYSSEVCHIQHKLVIKLDHPVMLAMTDGSRPPPGISTLRHKYFDLKSSADGHIIHGVFVRMESTTCGLLVDTMYMCLNKEAKSILTKIAHCSSAWWYWHWVEKGYTQGTMASLLNSFESDTAGNAHDSTYNPLSMTITSMFAGDDKNQWLDQVEE